MERTVETVRKEVRDIQGQINRICKVAKKLSRLSLEEKRTYLIWLDRLDLAKRQKLTAIVAATTNPN